MPKVDIIIPVYNVERFLRRCLDSVVSQTFTDWRAICVDDGSTDGCAAILDSYAAADQRFEVIHKENGGLSDARNCGMDAARAEYVMFVDSDDLIHPQTLEIALGLARRDGSDVVSWYRDSSYRNHQVKLLRALGMDPVSARPWGMRRHFDLSSVKSFTTDDLLPHCSDWPCSSKIGAVKHCYVWRHLFRRSAIADVKFIKGLKYEDIPWWSEVLLKPLRATVTDLPLYYYYPNLNSIAKGSPVFVKTVDILTGILKTHCLYASKASASQMQAWSHNIKWAVLYGTAPRLCRLTAMEGGDRIREIILDMYHSGVFDDAATIKELWARDCYLMSIDMVRSVMRQSRRRLKALKALIPG